jgi:hypothetical protein
VQSPAFQFLRRIFARFDQKPRAAFRPILKIDDEFLFPLPKKNFFLNLMMTKPPLKFQIQPKFIFVSKYYTAKRLPLNYFNPRKSTASCR